MKLIRTNFLGRHALSIFLLVTSGILNAQNISGVVNTYTPVSDINCNVLTVESATGFNAGDKVLIIQMKGAEVDLTNSPAFGTVVSYNEAGNYEFAVIATVIGTTVVLESSLLNAYNPAGLVQMISVPVYSNATVTSTLTCAPWNGSSGGVIVIEATGSLNLNADIDASNRGFLGGNQCFNPDGGCGSLMNYFYNVTSGFGAEKGEGIALLPAGYDGGRGSGSSGGGGGNKHNTGGGGGGNYSSGGRGGDQAEFCGVIPIGGEGGKALDYSSGKIFLGGGGGCSDNNNALGTLGTNGGGIIIIKTPVIFGNGYAIKSNANPVNVIPNGIGDGAGGGGAGGTLVLDVGVFTGLLDLEANGGDGGNQNTTYPSCFGTGGGGGTGVVLISGTSLPSNVTLQTIPGAAGVDIQPVSMCYLTTSGAAPGVAANGLITENVIKQNTIPAGNFNIDFSYPIPCQPEVVITVDTPPGASIQWSTGEMTPSIVVSTSGNYSYTVTLINGCIVSEEVIVESPTTPDVEILVTDDTICAGETIGLSYTASNTTLIDGLLWQYTSSISSLDEIADTPLNTTMYYLFVTDINGCVGIDSVEVVVYEVPDAFFELDTSGCSPLTVLFEAASASSVIYTWNTGHQNIELVGNSLSYTYVEPGVYDIGLVVANPACSVGYNIIEAITVNQTADANFSAVPSSTEIYVYDFVPLNPFPNDTYQWSFGNSGYSNESNPSFDFIVANGDINLVCLVANTVLACPDTFCLDIDRFNVSELYIPNAFTPDGDGNNESLVVYGSNIGWFKLEVYNRWGERVFFTEDIDHFWDGRFDGQWVPDGVYIVHVFYEDLITGKRHELHNHVAVLR